MQISLKLCQFLSVFAVSVSIGCGDPSPDPSPSGASDAGTGTTGGNPSVSAGNRSACVSYISKYNGLSCVMGSARIDPSVACPAALDTNGCNAKPYFDCVGSALVCKTVSGISYPDPSGALACQQQYACR